MSPESLPSLTTLTKGDIGRYVLLPGDPGRSQRIAERFDGPQLLKSNRQYVTYVGSLLGERVAVCSTGIGGASTAIAVEELIGAGADTFIRVGTSGGIQDGTRLGEVAIVTAAIRDEGASRAYLPIEFPAVADLDVVQSLREAAEQLGLPHRVGISHSKDSFFGEVEPARMPVSAWLLDRWKAWKMGGAICSEMEMSTILILSSIHRMRGGGVMLIAGNAETDVPEGQLPGQAEEALPPDISRAISTAIEGLKILIAKDAARQASSGRVVTP